MYEFLMVLNTVVWLGFVFDFVRRKDASVFHPAAFYLFFHGLIFVLRAPLVYYRGYDGIYRAFQFNPSMADKSTVLIGSTVGLIAFMFGTYQTARAPLRFRHTGFDLGFRRSLLKPFAIVAAFCVPLALYSLRQNWLDRSISYSSKVLDDATGVFVNTTANGYMTDAQLMLGPLSVLIAWIFRFRPLALLPLAAFVFLRAGTGGRWPLVAAFVMLGVLYLYDKRRRLPTMTLVAAGLALLAAFSLIGQDRGRAVRNIVMEDRSVDYLYASDKRFLEGMDFANLEYFEYLVYVIPQRSGTHGYFLNNLQIFTEPIPRKFWPGKPIAAPIKLYSLFDYGRPLGMTNSLPGEGWAQLGYIGVVFWCGLMGLLTGWFYSWFMRSRQTTLHVALYAMVLAQYFTFFRDGLLLTLLRTGFWFMIPLLLILALTWAMRLPSAWDMELAAKARAAFARKRRGKAEAEGAPGEGTAGEAATTAEEPAMVPRSRRQSLNGGVPRAWRRKAGLQRS